MDNSSLGERVKIQRQKLGFTQEELGEISDVTSAYIGQIERNERTPSLKRIKKIAKQLDVSVEYLVVGAKDSIQTDEDIMFELQGTNEKQRNLIIEMIKIIKKYS